MNLRRSGIFECLVLKLVAEDMFDCCWVLGGTQKNDCALLPQHVERLAGETVQTFNNIKWSRKIQKMVLKIYSF